MGSLFSFVAGIAGSLEGVAQAGVAFLSDTTTSQMSKLLHPVYRLTHADGNLASMVPFDESSDVYSLYCPCSDAVFRRMS